MNMREMQPHAAARLIFSLPISIVFYFLLAGCGAPGDPRPPRKVVPAAIGDLAARQQGEGVALSFAAPQASADGEALAEPPEIEIYRGTLRDDGTADPDSFHMVYTVPGAMLPTLSAGGQVRFRDVISAEELRAHPGAGYAYRVRSRVSKKRASGDSNTVILRLYPPPERVNGLAARLTESAIQLTWSAAAAGGAAVSGYRVYRGELEPGSATEAAADPSKAKWKSPPALLGPAAGREFADTQFVFGATYLYTVRAVSAPAGDEANSLESPDSAALVVEARDIFPPGAPQGLVAVYVPGGERPAGQAELSWSMNAESDLAGYRVYRSEKEGTAGAVLTPELLPTPAFRDNSIQAGHHYWYTVTAVDRSGNESAASGAADLELAETQP
ncbi:MAG: hypothetical protein LAN71_02250 [Acidobacteriia bacterium]|nr:hypothetical protein [Terriglobia bacterium]